jgi:hypothetical protein
MAYGLFHDYPTGLTDVHKKKRQPAIGCRNETPEKHKTSANKMKTKVTVPSAA